MKPPTDLIPADTETTNQLYSELSNITDNLNLFLRGTAISHTLVTRGERTETLAEMTYELLSATPEMIKMLHRVHGQLRQLLSDKKTTTTGAQWFSTPTPINQ